MLEGTIKLHGQQGAGKTLLLLALEKVLAQPEFSDLRIVCKTQQPGQPAETEVIFTKPVGAKAKLRSSWRS